MKKPNFSLIPLLALASAVCLYVGGCAATPTARSTGALVQDAIVSAFDVGVDTFKGVVQLNGFVDTDVQRARAEEIARGVAGVTNVQNRLSVKSQAGGADPNRGPNPAGPPTTPVPPGR